MFKIKKRGTELISTRGITIPTHQIRTAHAERGRLNLDIGGIQNWRVSKTKSKAKRFIC